MHSMWTIKSWIEQRHHTLINNQVKDRHKTHKTSFNAYLTIA